MSTEDIVTGLAAFFEQDHRDCDARWTDVEELLDTADTDSARGAWQKYDAGMRRHLAMEEDVLFKSFDAMSEVSGAGTTAVLRMEHQQIRKLLDQIGSAIASGDAESALNIGDTLLILTEQHNAREEATLYPAAETILGEQWGELSSRLEKY